MACPKLNIHQHKQHSAQAIEKKVAATRHIVMPMRVKAVARVLSLALFGKEFSDMSHFRSLLSG